MSTSKSPNDRSGNDKGERSHVLWSNVIMWMLVIVVPVALFVVLEQVALVTLPNGDVFQCERQLTESLSARITVTPLLIGQISHEEQTIEYAVNGGEWRPLVDMTLNLPDVTPDCESNLGSSTNGLAWAWNGKIVLISADSGMSWQQWEVCDDPRPVFGCVRDEYIVSVNQLSSHDILVSVVAREGNYTIVSGDIGLTWKLVDDNEIEG